MTTNSTRLSDMELSERKFKLEEILRGATPLLLEGYTPVPGGDSARKKLLGTQTKTSHKDLVTVFDQKVEAFITEALRKAFPTDVIIGEEASAAKKEPLREKCKNLDGFWLIDPIDGTTNYSRAYPFFCSTAAYIRKGNYGRFAPVVAATWDPVHSEMFSAAEGGGAWLNRQKLHVTDVSDPENALLTTGFASERSHTGERSFELFKQLTKLTLGVRRDGSAALDLAYVACGRIDAYWEWGLAPWDIAAGILLVREASGCISHHDGQPIDIFSGEILSSNELLNKWLIDRLKG